MNLNLKGNKNIVQNFSRYVRKKIESFYVQETYLLFNSFDRPYLVGIFLIIFRQYEILQFNFNNDSYKQLLNNNQSTNSYIKAMIMEQWPNLLVEFIFYILFVLNIILYLYLAFRLSLYLSGRQFRNLKIFSLLFRAYTYINFIASIYASLCFYSKQSEMSIINIFLTISLQFIICSTDFDIRYTTKDYLAKKSSKHDYFFITLKIVVIFVIKFGSYKILPFFGFFFNLIKLIYLYIYHPFQNFKIQQIEFSLTLTNVGISFIMLGEFNNYKTDFIFGLLVCIPLSYQAGYYLMTHKLLQNNIKALTIIHTQKGVQKTVKQLERIDLFLRYVAYNVSTNLSHYLESPNSLILEKIVTEHHLNCEEYPHCFCRKYQDEEITKNDFVGDNIRKQYLEYYIRNTYISECKLLKNQSSDFLFSYYAFMINWTKNQTTSFREILSHKEKYSKRITLRQKMLLKYIFNLASQQFELEAQRIYQKTHGQLLDIISFDENLEDASSQYRQCLKEKQELLLIMCKDYINLNQLEKQALKLQERRTRLQDDLVRLFQVNSTSLSLLSLCEGFEECLTIEPIFRMMYLNKIKLGQKKNRIPYYQDDSCAIFISLLNDIGKILKVSKNFKDVVPIVKKNSDAIGRNVNFLMNEEIAIVHDAILLHCVQKKLVNQDMKHYPTIIGIDSDGWSIPYSFKVQLCMLSDKQLGACGWLKQIVDGNLYVTTSPITENYRFNVFDEKFFNILFKGNFTQNEAKKIRLGLLMPIMKHLAQKGSPGSSYETIIIKPINISEASIERDIYDPNIIQDLTHLNLYQIRFTYYPVNTHYVQFVAFQVYHLKPLYDVNQKREAIKNFRIQIQEYADAEVIKQKLVNQQNKLIEIRETSKDNFGSIDSSMLGINSLSYIEDNLVSMQKRTDGRGTRKESLVITPRNFQMDLQQKYVKASQQNIQNDSESQYYDTPRDLTSLQDVNSQKRQIEEEYFKVENNRVKQLNNGYAKGKPPTVKSEQMIVNQLLTQNQNAQLMQGQPGILMQEAPLKALNGFRDQKLILNTNLNDFQNIDSANQQHIMSDSTYFSPASSQRKALIFPDTQRQYNTDAIIYDTAIQENTAAENGDEEGYQNDNPRKRVSSFKNSMYSQSRKKNVSIQENLPIMKNNINLEQIISNSNDVVDQDLEFEDQNSQELSNQAQEDLEEETQNKFKEGERDSTKTGKTSKSSVRQHMLNTIRSKKFSNSLRATNMIGVVSIIIIFSLNIISFFIQYDDLLNQQSNFQKIFWIYQEKKYLSLMFANQGIQNSFDTGLISYANKSDLQQLGQTLKYFSNYTYISYYEYMRMATQVTNRPVYVFEVMNSYDIQVLILDSIYHTKFAVKVNFYYEMLYFINFLNVMMYNKYDGGYSQESMYANYQYIFMSLEDVYRMNLKNFNSQINETKLLLTIQLVLISVVTGLFALLMIPVHIHSQNQKEEILKLFATIAPDKIIYMMQSISMHLDQQERIELQKQKMRSSRFQEKQFLQSARQYGTGIQIRMSQSNRASVYSKNYENIQKSLINLKKKNTSSTNNIPKISRKFLLGLFFGLISMQFYGVSKFILGSLEIDDFQTQINFLASFDMFFDNIASQINARYNLIPGIDNQYIPLETKQNYLDFSSGFQQAGPQKLNLLLNQFQNYENFSGSQKQKYQNFLQPLFKSNVCDVIQNSPQSYIENLEFNVSQCQNLLGGVFQQGLFVVAQKYMEIYNNFMEGVVNLDVNQAQATMENMYQTLNLNDEFNFSIQIMMTTKIVHNFFQDIYSIDFNQNLMISVILLVVQLVILLFVLLVGWRIYYKGIGTQFYQTKQLLDLIDLTILLESPYVVSYFKKNT
ncbi:transmembrane protein, putative (macronuclear) [Tetrahymena thermophila SB210]|uniref:Transmembrane protein, putative n=1 Tax=Tetrahymena thermophila (strain SB210) TaxID=312017 RepID=Q23R47_TETTS|nr:transmembrane protein, putative [Tetrahymena thermophila SB210]EAR98994.2 transmembrane protein, putative [Tetrahymena thermophila SB210]|eukprot:XP_001019239.2 transmembrane protein, putative [Tetrahymena thermophila SB210]